MHERRRYPVDFLVAHPWASLLILSLPGGLPAVLVLALVVDKLRRRA